LEIGIFFRLDKVNIAFSYVFIYILKAILLWFWR